VQQLLLSALLLQTSISLLLMLPTSRQRSTAAAVSGTAVSGAAVRTGKLQQHRDCAVCQLFELLSAESAKFSQVAQLRTSAVLLSLLLLPLLLLLSTAAQILAAVHCVLTLKQFQYCGYCASMNAVLPVPLLDALAVHTLDTVTQLSDSIAAAWKNNKAV
jgi:hypothetical protein